MYRIDTAAPNVVDAYTDDMASKLKPIIDDYLAGQRELVFPVDGQDIHVVVLNGSLTHNILTVLSDLEELKKFLKMGVKLQFRMVENLKRDSTPDDLIFKKLGLTTYKRHFKRNPTIIDHFNEIIYDIFVTNGYDAHVNTTQFISNTGLKICPYCGNEKVKESNRTKTDLDHFLPKRKYPLFALCYYNLIPSCIFCNRADHKGQLSPIEEINNGLKVQNPYIFNPSIVRFHLCITDAKVYEPENFSVVVGFSEKAFLDGYDRFFDICDRYASNMQEVAEDYMRLMDFKADHFYDEMNVDKVWLKKAYRAVMGYTPNSDYPHLKERHRMRGDIFAQLIKLRKPAPYFIKGSGNNTVVLE